MKGFTTKDTKVTKDGIEMRKYSSPFFVSFVTFVVRTAVVFVRLTSAHARP